MAVIIINLLKLMVFKNDFDIWKFSKSNKCEPSFQFSILHRLNLVTMGSLIQELQDIQIFQICHYIFSEHLVLRIFPTFERCCHQLMDSSYIQILQIHKFDSDATIQDPSEHCILCILKLYGIKLNLLLMWELWLRCNSRNIHRIAKHIMFALI